MLPKYYRVAMLPTYIAVADPPLLITIAVIALVAPLSYTSPSPRHLPTYRKRHAAYYSRRHHRPRSPIYLHV